MHYYDVELLDPFQMDVNFFFPEDCENLGEAANGLLSIIFVVGFIKYYVLLYKN